MNWADFAMGTGAGILLMMGAAAGSAMYVMRNPAFLVRRMMKATRGTHRPRRAA